MSNYHVEPIDQPAALRVPPLTGVAAIARGAEGM